MLIPKKRRWLQCQRQSMGINNMPEIVADNISVINSDELEGATRLEAEYYQPAYLSLMKSLKRISTIQLNTIAFVTDGIHASIDYDDSSPIYCLSAQSIKDGLFDLSAKTMIAVSQHNKNLRTGIQCGDVIISSMGTIGFSAVAYREILPANAVRQVLIVRVNELEKRDSDYPYFISAFLNSKYGMFQSIREATGNVQQHLFIDKVINFKIPQLSNIEYIGGIYKKAEIKFIESNNLYSQAETLLLEELGIKDIDLSHEPCYEVNSGDTITARRIDAEYYQPKYERVIEVVRKRQQMPTIADVFDFIRGEFIDTKYYTENKTSRSYIRIKELSNNSTINADEVVYIKDEYKNSKTTMLKKGDLVIAIIGDTIGKTNLILEEFEGGFCSNNTGMLRLKESYKNRFDMFFLEKLFHNIFIQLQIEKRKAQTGQPKIDDKEIKEIGIPLVDYKKQCAIGDLIRQSHSARRQAKGLLEEAKRNVEEMIEKGSE